MPLILLIQILTGSLPWKPLKFFIQTFFKMPDKNYALDFQLALSSHTATVTTVLCSYNHSYGNCMVDNTPTIALTVDVKKFQ